MKQLLFLFGSVSLITLSACNKFKTDASTGREFLLRHAPRTQHFGPGVLQFTGENGMSFSISGPYISLETGDTLTGSPEFWLNEYVNKKDMMFAGIPTVSGNQVIATAGAFKLSTRVNGELARPAEINYVVPAVTPNQLMMPFVGLVNGESQFGWVPLGSPIFIPLQWGDSTFLGNGGPGYQGFVNPLQEYYANQESIYINCDYFPNWGIPLTDIHVRTSAEVNLTPLQNSVSVLFDSLNVYMAGQWNGTNDWYDFINVPIGFDVLSLAVGIDNNQNLYFGMMELTIEENGVYTYNMEPITEEELEDILDGL